MPVSSPTNKSRSPSWSMSANSGSTNVPIPAMPNGFFIGLAKDCWSGSIWYEVSIILVLSSPGLPLKLLTGLNRIYVVGARNIEFVSERLSVWIFCHCSSVATRYCQLPSSSLFAELAVIAIPNSWSLSWSWKFSDTSCSTVFPSESYVSSDILWSSGLFPSIAIGADFPS